MNIGIFTNTPAHVHLYRECIATLDEQDHHVTVFARDDGPTLELLDYYEIPYRVYGTRDITRSGLIRELPGQLWTIARLVRPLELDLVLGMGVYSTYAAVLANCRAITVMDSEPMAIKQRLTAPLVSAFLTPASFRRDLGSKHFEFEGFKETAYLHPDVFEPTGDVHDALGIDADEAFVIVRFNAFNGHHDVGQRGFSLPEKRSLIERLATHATVLVSDESDRLDLTALPARAYDAHPARIHDALSEAELLIADTQTMVTEAAILGTPTIRSNSFVEGNDMGNFRTLADAGLVYNLSAFHDVVETAETLLDGGSTAETWMAKREQFLADKCNLTEILVDVINEVGRTGCVSSAIHENRSLRPRSPVRG